MSPTWDDGQQPRFAPPGLAGHLRATARAVPLFVLVFGGLLLLLALRLIEAPLYGLHRPWTPAITRFVCRTALRLVGLRLSVTGRPLATRGAMVANHSSWLDIFALNASAPIYFVSKSEVAGWPGIGWLARATGTVFIERTRTRARDHADLFETRLLAGHRLVFFPEGTSTDGAQVLPFKTTLFDAFFRDELKHDIQVQPVAVRYLPAPGTDPRAYAWWGGMSFGPHLWAILALPGAGTVKVAYLEPLKPADVDNRKALAAACQRAVQDAHARLQ